ncbi:hypothetical protein C9374_001511 [Naegleria lovaniensis]|uniref:Uncharacterized protein n=1 Tax=Naegleria lovaniensis TaxID=51637 RepID=A0AA88GW15_NAELO|nr:uncharacterized protein C9374_001511 [Naegleria lovaniensis]KAG2387179.1 hypothetical protein C9374_001511 [Naegleria lovaniensis]
MSNQDSSIPSKYLTQLPNTTITSTNNYTSSTMSDLSIPSSSSIHSSPPSRMGRSISYAGNLQNHDRDDNDDNHTEENSQSSSLTWTTIESSPRNRRKSNQDRSSPSLTPLRNDDSSSSPRRGTTNSSSTNYSPSHHHYQYTHGSTFSTRSMSSPALLSESRGSMSSLRSLHNESFEMIPLTVLTLWKLEDYSVTMATPLHGGTSPAKEVNETNPFDSVRTNEFHTFIESDTTSTTRRRPEMVRGDSYMLMWCPWFNMYDNLFIEFWLVKLDESATSNTSSRSNTSSSSNDNFSHTSYNSKHGCSPSSSMSPSADDNNNFRILPVRQHAKALSKQATHERFFSGNIWGYSVVLNSSLDQKDESILPQYLTNAFPSASTHFFGNDLENLIICFFGTTKIFKFKLNVMKELHKNHKSKIKSEYVTNVESIDFVEALDYKSLRVHYATTPSSVATTPTDVFFDVVNTVEEEEEMIDELYQSLFDSSSIISDNAKKSLRLMSRIEMIHDHLQGYGFVRCDIQNNCHLYSLNKKRPDSSMQSPISANESISDDSFLELESPRNTTTTLSVCERRAFKLAHQSLSLVFFQRQIARKQYLNLKSPTSGRFEMNYSPHSKNTLKIGFEKIGHILPFHVDSGKLNMMNHSNIKICKFDENLFLVLEIDEKNMKKQWENYQLLRQQVESMTVTSNNESLPTPIIMMEQNLLLDQDKEFDALQFFKFYILDLSKSDDVKLSRLFTSYDVTQQASHATTSQFSTMKIHEAFLKITSPKSKQMHSSTSTLHNTLLSNRNTTSETYSHNLHQPHQLQQNNLQVHLQHNMLPVYRSQKSKKKRFDFMYEKLVSHMIVFRGDMLKNPYQYTIALFYNVKGDRYFFSTQHDFNGIGEWTKLRGKWFDFIHFTHVGSRSKTLFDQANLMLNVGVKPTEGNGGVVSGLGFPDISLRLKSK